MPEPTAVVVAPVHHRNDVKKQGTIALIRLRSFRSLFLLVGCDMVPTADGESEVMDRECFGTDGRASSYKYVRLHSRLCHLVKLTFLSQRIRTASCYCCPC